MPEGWYSGHVIDGTDVNTVTRVARSNCEPIATFVTEMRSTASTGAGIHVVGMRRTQNTPAERRCQAGYGRAVGYPRQPMTTRFDLFVVGSGFFGLTIAERVASQAVEVYGGYGFVKDYPVEKFYRDVKLCTIGEGTSEIQRLVIARQLLKD